MLIIGKREKGNKIVLYRSAVNEVESYTLLKLTVKEAHQIIDAGNEAGDKWELVDEKYYTTYYQSDDKLDKTWKALAHSRQTNSNFHDVHKVYFCGAGGTSVLLRDPKTHVIKIAHKKGNLRCTINRIGIDNQKRQQFFRDCRKAHLLAEGVWGIDLRDENVYKYWDEYMTRKYLENIQKEVS